jgi:hypothetical protein
MVTVSASSSASKSHCTGELLDDLTLTCEQLGLAEEAQRYWQRYFDL